MKTIHSIMRILNEGFGVEGDSGLHRFEQKSGETNQSGDYDILATLVANDQEDVYMDAEGTLSVVVDRVPEEAPSVDSWGAAEELHLTLDTSKLKWSMPNEETKAYVRKQIELHGEDKFYEIIFGLLEDLVREKLA